jgi:hypothetical protein
VKPLSEVADSRLEWLEPRALQRRYELRLEEELYATLEFRSAWGTLATAHAADGAWTFKRVGFLNPRITVREVGQKADMAIYHPKFWGGGELVFAGGQAFHWKPANFWATRWAFSDGNDAVLLLYEEGRAEPKLKDVVKSEAVLEIRPQAADVGELPLLACLGWYLIILYQEDAGAAAAAAAAGAAY